MKKVFISAGHGGSDPGAVANGFKEKDLNLSIALACADYLIANGVNTKLSRTKDENDNIDQEAAESNAFNPDYTVSIHNNAGGGDGIEAWYQVDGSTKKLAENILAEAVKIGQNSRGAKTRANSNGTDYYGFIRKTKAPALIVECAFVDNAKDMQIIDTEAERKAMGIAIARGILKTLGIAEKAPASKPTTTPKPVATASEVEAGDVVSISSNATYYGGGVMPTWVKRKNWIVDEVNGNRAVVNKSEDGLNSINSPIDVKYLTVVKDANKSQTPSNTGVPFRVQVAISDLNIRTGAGTNYASTGNYCPIGVYTIVEVKAGPGSTNGWGKLKSGAGWISLDYASKIK